MALSRAIEAKTLYVNNDKGQGYIITPSGIDYIDGL